jgi:predicted alpha/beta superfamily hydrolase
MSPRRWHFHSIAGRVDVTSMLLHDRRVGVRTYLPPDYEWTDRAYRVLYMFDGHNLFDVRTSTYNQEWQIDETMERLAAEGMEPAIVVGIDAPFDKFLRYAMYTVGSWDYRLRPDRRVVRHIDGDGAATATFLMEEVRAATEDRYRVRTDREGIGVGGSSMGGYMSLYCAARYPEVIGKVIAMSPVVAVEPMRHSGLLEYLHAAGAPQHQRIWIDMGDEEELAYIESPEQLVANLWEVAEVLGAMGHRDVAAHVIAGGDHTEHSWAARFEQAYRWVFDGVAPGFG